MKQRTKEEETKITIAYAIISNIQALIDNEKKCCEEYIADNTIGNDLFDRETRRDRERISYVYTDALMAACSIVRETIRNARIPC